MTKTRNLYMPVSYLPGLLLLLAILTAIPSPAVAAAFDRQQLNAFIEAMASQDQFSRDDLTLLFRQVRLQQRILDAIARPAEGKPWFQYRPIFLTGKRIRQGLEFRRKHAVTLARAEHDFGVPAEIITAIIGVETFYGRHAGNYRVIDALATLGFNYPQRGEFFRKELRHFLLLAREQGFQPQDLLGSYAGAMGIPQFMPSSFRSYAVDFDADGVKDIWKDPDDAIGSVANYLSRHGWQAGEDITVRVPVPPGNTQQFLGQGLKPTIPLQQLRAAGMRSARPIGGNPLVTLLSLQLEQGQEQWLGMQNFYVITRYNHSPLYAMAVYQLASAIEQAYQQAGERAVQVGEKAAG